MCRPVGAARSPARHPRAVKPPPTVGANRARKQTADPPPRQRTVTHARHCTRLARSQPPVPAGRAAGVRRAGGLIQHPQPLQRRRRRHPQRVRHIDEPPPRSTRRLNQPGHSRAGSQPTLRRVRCLLHNAGALQLYGLPVRRALSTRSSGMRTRRAASPTRCPSHYRPS